MAYEIDGNDLGDVFDERFPPKSNLDHVTFPLSASSEAFVYDYNGVARVITIKGKKTFANEAALWDWISAIDILQNGNQPIYVYHSDGWDKSTSGNYTDGNFNVKIDSFDPKPILSTPLAVEYTLVMFEGS